jgi:hypothetical protein
MIIFETFARGCEPTRYRTDLGGDVLALSPGDFGKFIADATDKWAKVIKFAGIKAD